MKITFVYSCIPVRGHSITTWTDFCPFLTTHLPLVDKRGHLADHLPFVHVDIQKLTTSPPKIDNIVCSMYLLYLVEMKELRKIL